MPHQNLFINHSKYDLMRGVAALLVLLSHANQIFIRRLLPNQELIFTLISTLARHSVLVFFLLSGFLITNSIISNIKRNQYFDIKSYLAARITRIYPPLIGSIIVVFICWLIIYSFDLPGKFNYGIASDTFVMREKFVFTFKDIYLVLTMQNGMLQANGPLWSLYLECIIYITAMFCGLAITTKSKLLKCVWLCFAVYLCFYGFKINANFGFFFLVWIIGSLLSFYGSLRGVTPLEKSSFLFNMCIVWLVILGLINWRFLVVTKEDSSIHLVAQFSFCILYAHLIFVSPAFNRFNSKFFAATGDYSYSLYIVHFPLLLLFFSITQTWMSNSLLKSFIALLASLIVTLFFARIFARYFEDQLKFKPLVVWIINVVSLKFKVIK